MVAVRTGSSQGALARGIGRVPKSILTLLAAWFLAVSPSVSQTLVVTPHYNGANVNIPGKGLPDVVCVVTMRDNAFAFDSDSSYRDFIDRRVARDDNCF